MGEGMMDQHVFKSTFSFQFVLVFQLTIDHLFIYTIFFLLLKLTSQSFKNLLYLSDSILISGLQHTCENFFLHNSLSKLGLLRTKRQENIMGLWLVSFKIIVVQWCKFKFWFQTIRLIHASFNPHTWCCNICISSDVYFLYCNYISR